MSPKNFTYWLQGFFELTGSDDLTEEQVQTIKDHLALVFTKVTPDRGKKGKGKKVKVPKELGDPPYEESFFITPETNDKDRSILTCDDEPGQVTPSAEKLMKTVKESAKKSQERRLYPSPSRWIYGISGQKYC